MCLIFFNGPVYQWFHICTINSLLVVTIVPHNHLISVNRHLLYRVNETGWIHFIFIQSEHFFRASSEDHECKTVSYTLQTSENWWVFKKGNYCVFLFTFGVMIFGIVFNLCFWTWIIFYIGVNTYDKLGYIKTTWNRSPATTRDRFRSCGVDEDLFQENSEFCEKSRQCHA